MGGGSRRVMRSNSSVSGSPTSRMPAELADDTLDILGSPNPAELRVSQDVQRVLGRAPHPFADWAAHNVAAFR
ncbi:hypothetical protein Spla01_01322 [Streptomyces platensis]|uniref:Uncharacterized protein n=1 Tax=Streptomyces platensis TaxID=58346 RepID=A0ABX3Y4Q3_STRPT|nr:hypothetical protein BG653_00743 [Streptomyces platensis]